MFGTMSRVAQTSTQHPGQDSCGVEKRFQNPHFGYGRIVEIVKTNDDVIVHIVTRAGMVMVSVTRFISTEVFPSTEDCIYVTAYDRHGDAHVYSVTVSLCSQDTSTDDKLDRVALEINEPYMILPKSVWVVVMGAATTVL